MSTIEMNTANYRLMGLALRPWSPPLDVKSVITIITSDLHTDATNGSAHSTLCAHTRHSSLSLAESSLRHRVI